MLNEMKTINEWPDTFESFIAKYSTSGSPRMIEDYLIFQAVEHYFPTKECRTCEFFRQTKSGVYCADGVTFDVCTGYVSPNFGCIDWRARE